ncbi:hypothetical protein Moror_1857 [Moniliophthora roreri MCA 2997]|uniref:Uncharacterized protein n=1 Tax=Moniliophthora roreri (strain MCA 2997) TaxID=1381753 RepID=V2X5I8_MONRO|nr:hypothetical protein Moror_1857 [Moniliophthora roreri MCA 2997]KAI3614455.1 hypothetical protein WG66_009741 [Moniliophthora roreri]
MSFYYYTETIGSNNVVNNGGQTPWITTDQTSYRSSISPGSSESTGSNNVVSNGGQTPWITTGQTSYTSSISPGSCCTFNGGTVNISATPPGSFVGQILTCSYTDSRGVRTTYNGTVVVDDRERVNRTRTRGQVRSTSRTGIVSIPGHTDSTAITATDTITLTTTYNGCDIPLYMAPPGSTVGQRLIDGVVLRRPGKRIVFNGCTVVENPPGMISNLSNGGKDRHRTRNKEHLLHPASTPLDEDLVPTIHTLRQATIYLQLRTIIEEARMT